MKYAILSIAALFLSNLAPAPALAQTPRALEISIFGIGPAVDLQALEAVRSVIASAITKGVVDTYITYGYGIEGGTASCIQLSPYEDSEKLLQLQSELLQIQPNRETTSYDVKAVAACTQQSGGPVQVSELADTQWLLEDLAGTDVLDRPPQPTLRFIGTDRIAGQGGCNSYSAKFQIDGLRLTVSRLLATKRACVDPRSQAQENRYFRGLERVQRISLSGSDLLIYSEGEEQPLRFSRLAPSSQSER